MKNFSPLEVFNINFFNLNRLFFSPVFLLFLFSLIVLIFFLSFSLSHIKITKSNQISSINYVFLSITNLYSSIVLSRRALRFLPFVLSIFFLILLFNFSSLCFYQTPFTAHIFITFLFVFIVFFSFFINNIINFDYKFFFKFIQKDLNIFLTILLYLVEIISYLIKPVSLSIRLFANMLSGHILLHIFFSFYIFVYKIIIFFSILVLFFCFFILILEMFVAIIQAYIFMVLVLVYLNDALYLHN